VQSGLPALVRRYRSAYLPACIIAFGVALRFVLITIGWPHSDSEEGTMGLEGLHILVRSERPIYLYGQSYMGAVEAYAAALSFRVFGVSTVSLRLGMIAFYAIFMIGVFWLASQLYSRRVALMSLAILVFGTPFLVQVELLADGGKIETLAFGATLFALATWLALHAPTEPLARRQRWHRYLAFAAWGVIAGLGLYTYAVIAPFILSSGLLLWVTCRRELRGWALALPIVGLLAGLLPVIIYTATMPLADNPISVFLFLHQTLNSSQASTWHLLVKQVEATLLYTLPTVTGLITLYPAQAMPFYGPLGLQTFAPVILGGGWSLVYLVLLGMATWHPLQALRKHRMLRRTGQYSGSDHLAAARTSADAGSSTLARDVARLMLALAAWLTIVIYMASPAAARNPYSGRYMIGLLIVLPAVLWPMIEGWRHTWPICGDFALVWRPAVLLLLCVNLLAGAVATTQLVPATVALNRQDTRLAHDLLSRGITQFYTDYWTCDLLSFATQERLVCGVVDLYAQPGFIRYPPHFAAVQANRSAPYLFVSGSLLEQTFAKHMAAIHQAYSVEHVDGYVVNTPLLPAN
jgi:hypothetical protein